MLYAWPGATQSNKTSILPLIRGHVSFLDWGWVMGAHDGVGEQVFI